MKKTKLLTSLACLTLVISLGACSQANDDVDSGNEEVTSLLNYTISISFTDEGGAQTLIPDYAAAYIVGDWDWNTFLPLTETDGVYSYTFSSISIGTHEYKGVMWYLEDIVSWIDCVEIISEGSGNATLEVLADEGDGFTKELSFVLTETLQEKTITYDSVADLFLAMKETENFTLTLQYYDWCSEYTYPSESVMKTDYELGTMVRYGHNNYLDMTFTKDAVLLEYFANSDDYLNRTYFDVELYVNEYDTNQVAVYYTRNDSSSSNPVDYTDLKLAYRLNGNGTWQTLLYSPLDLVDYSDHFIEGESSESNPNAIDYSIDIDLDFLKVLDASVYSIFYNYFDSVMSHFSSYLTNHFNSYGAPSVSATYYKDSGIFNMNLYYWIEHVDESSTSTSGYEYWLEYSSIYTTFSKVGSTSLPSAYLQYLS